MDETQKLIEELKSGHDAFLAALRGVTEDFARRGPGNGKWSVLQCVEHVAIAQEHMFNQVETAKPADMSGIDSRRENIIAKRLRDRSKKVDAPDIAKPIGRFASLAEATETFQSSHSRALSFVERNREDLRSLLTVHPLIGPVNCYEMIVIIAAHPARHAKQIEEIKSQLAGVVDSKEW